MPTQRTTTQRQLYFGLESTEGVKASTLTSRLMPRNLSVSPDVAFNARSFVGQLGKFTGKMGEQANPTLSFTIDLAGADNGSGIAPSYDLLLRVVLAQGVTDTGDTTVQAGSADRHTINVASLANFSVGNAVAIETTSTSDVYELGWITGTLTSPNRLVLAHDLTFDALNGAAVKPSTTYKPKDSGHESLTFQMWLDASNCITFLGCKGSVKMDAPAPGALPTLTFVFKAMSWLQESGSRPSTTPDSAVAQPSYKFKIGNSATDIKLANWDLQQFVARKRSQNSSAGTVAELVVDRALRGFVQTYNTDASPTQLDHWNNGAEHDLSHQFGSTLSSIAGYRIPKAQRVTVSYGDDNSLTTDQLSFDGNITVGADELRLAFL